MWRRPASTLAHLSGFLANSPGGACQTVDHLWGRTRRRSTLTAPPRPAGLASTGHSSPLEGWGGNRHSNFSDGAATAVVPWEATGQQVGGSRRAVHGSAPGLAREGRLTRLPPGAGGPRGQVGLRRGWGRRARWERGGGRGRGGGEHRRRRGPPAPSNNETPEQVSPPGQADPGGYYDLSPRPRTVIGQPQPSGRGGQV